MKANKEMLHREYSMIWSDDRMTNYCTNKVSTMAILPDGGIVTVEKAHIEKDFCFGESGYDMDDAVAAAEHARTSQEYFFSRNMAGFKSYIDSLEASKDDNSNCWLHISDSHYTGQTNECHLRCIQFARTTEVLEELGSSFLSELYGKRVKIRGMEGHLGTIEEIDRVLEAYKEAAADHEKKVRSYLKRYGTSKVHSWTYWRDA